MGLTVLNNQFRIKIANDDFLSNLNKYSHKFKKGKVLFQILKDKKLEYFYSTTNIYILKSLDLWFSHIEHGNKTLYVFGSGKPKETGSNVPFCNIDFSILGDNKNSSAVFAQDDHGNVSILYRVNPDNLSLKSFELEFGGDWVSAQEEGRNNYFIFMGSFNQNFLDTFKEFLKVFESITNFKNESSTEVQDNVNKDLKTCLMCEKKFQPIKSDYEKVIKSFDINSSDYCTLCTEKIAAAYILEEIRDKINLTVFNKKSLLERVENKSLFESYLNLLIKLGYYKEINKDLLMLNKNEDLNVLINKYKGKSQAPSSYEESIKVQKCIKCGVVLSDKNSYKSDSLSKDLTLCKDCSRKVYAVKALNQLEEYVEPGVPFNKDDLLKQVDSKTRFLDYIWTLQEFDLLEIDDRSGFYILKPEKELIIFEEKYGDGIEDTETALEHSSSTCEKKPSRKIVKECKICKRVMPVSSFYKDSTSDDGFMSKCKDCSRKSYAAKALSELKKYVDLEVEFNKEDLLKQAENKTQALDYFWTLQEFDFIKHNEKSDSYMLTPEEMINSFIQLYDEHVEPQTPKAEESSPVNKITKKCKTCEKILPTSDFYKSSESADGYTENCKKCSDNINAAKILSEIEKYIGIGNSFSKKELSNQLGNPTKVNYYIWVLQEHNLIEHDQKNDTYVIDNSSNYQIYETLLEKLTGKKRSNDSTLLTDVNLRKIKKDIQFKEIIHYSKSIQNPDKKTMILRGLISQNNLYPVLEEIKDVIPLNMLEMSFNRINDDLIKFILELEIDNNLFEKTIKLLEENDWKTRVNETKS